MLRPVTIWYRYDRKNKEWKYNHFEFGISEFDNPIPQSDEQERWDYMKWRKCVGFYQRALGRTKVVENYNIIT